MHDPIGPEAFPFTEDEVYRAERYDNPESGIGWRMADGGCQRAMHRQSLPAAHCLPPTTGFSSLPAAVSNQPSIGTTQDSSRPHVRAPARLQRSARNDG